MAEQLRIQFCITGTADGTITKEMVMDAYNYLLKIPGRNLTGEKLYREILEWITYDVHLDTDCDVDECQIADWEIDTALRFIKECVETDGLHIDEEGQTHLFDPEQYEVGEWELERRKREEYEELMKRA